MGKAALRPNRDVLIAAALAVVSAVGGFGAYRYLAGRPAPVQMPELVLTDLEGKKRSLSEWKGKLLLVNFWASWCGPCLKEIPMLVTVQNEFAGRGLQIVGPAMDQPELARQWAQRLGVNYPVMAGDTEVAQAMDALGDQLQALPFSVLIAPDGTILHRKHGEFTREELSDLLEDHLSS